ncbi:MAG: hypothetical protein ACYTF3_03760 [Planctomycetota bacterium]|jgi:hypothetical protein
MARSHRGRRVNQGRLLVHQLADAPEGRCAALQATHDETEHAGWRGDELQVEHHRQEGAQRDAPVDDHRAADREPGEDRYRVILTVGMAF